jgi:phosphoglycerol transferase MdoB-like AlkP superfamily enzyme
VKLPRAQNGFFTMAALLREHGYATDFIYGGESHFDNMAAFMLGNGFERALDESDWEDPAFRGTWGVSDEDLMRKAHEIFLAHGDRPFFALVLSTSNHSPFDYPPGRIELYDPEPATRRNAMKYADHAIGELFRLARRADYYEHTVWIVAADHDTRVRGDQLIPVSHFHIPGLILAPGLAPGRYEKVASQVDLMPTALHLLGIETTHPMIGRNLFTWPEGDPGRAVLQYYDNHGFLVGDRLVVHAGTLPARCFRHGDGRLVPDALDPELVRDALAHALLPELVYAQERYRLPVRTAR